MSAETTPDVGAAVVALYQRLIAVCLVGGVHSRCGWGAVVRNLVLPLLREHPKLRHLVGVLTDGFDRVPPPGSPDAPNAARSLHTLSVQVARHAAAILRQEVAVLEQNLARHDQNLAAAGGFTRRANRVLQAEMASAEQPIRQAAEEAMQRTANLTGEDSAPLFDESAVTRAIYVAGERIIDRLLRGLAGEVARVREEIADRAYDDRTYDGDARVEVSFRRPSIELPADQIGPRLRRQPIPPKLAVPAETGSLVEAGRRVWERVASATRLITERTATEKQRDKRTALLERCRKQLPAVAEEYRRTLTREVEEAIRQATSALCQEAERCFNLAFESRRAAVENLRRWREQADAVRVPPPLLYTATCILRARHGADSTS
jgi:hypothetical protein